MTMGRTPVPLTIFAPVEWHGQLKELSDKGHLVLPLWLDPAPDLILHPRAHWWDEAWFEGSFGRARLEAALRAARARRKGGSR